mmetsp:Transcript_131949/g.186221  ORF Transcript_131949/g.186221 Transcript_131949/m.186221 type:complete len:522 (+) Transcript_131949:619-2184(+)
MTILARLEGKHAAILEHIGIPHVGLTIGPRVKQEAWIVNGQLGSLQGLGAASLSGQMAISHQHRSSIGRQAELAVVEGVVLGAVVAHDGRVVASAHQALGPLVSTVRRCQLTIHMDIDPLAKACVTPFIPLHRMHGGIANITTPKGKQGSVPLIMQAHVFGTNAKPIIVGISSKLQIVIGPKATKLINPTRQEIHPIVIGKIGSIQDATTNSLALLPLTAHLFFFFGGEQLCGHHLLHIGRMDGRRSMMNHHKLPIVRSHHSATVHHVATLAVAHLGQGSQPTSSMIASPGIDLGDATCLADALPAFLHVKATLGALGDSGTCPHPGGKGRAGGTAAVSHGFRIQGALLDPQGLQRRSTVQFRATQDGHATGEARRFNWGIINIVRTSLGHSLNWLPAFIDADLAGAIMITPEHGILCRSHIDDLRLHGRAGHHVLQFGLEGLFLVEAYRILGIAGIKVKGTQTPNHSDLHGLRIFRIADGLATDHPVHHDATNGIRATILATCRREAPGTHHISLVGSFG